MESSLEETKDLFDIFNDEKLTQYEFLKSKRVLINAKKGNNVLFDILKLKSRGLDMLILVLQNNKSILKSDDIYCISSLERIFKLAKNEKLLFESISRKIKTIANLVLRNQIALNKVERFPELSKFIVEILNTHFENSFLQQIIDIIKNEEVMFQNFVETFFSKFFKGRNIILKNQDIRYLIKNTIGCFGVNLYLEKLLKYINSKENGGARTTHQINQVFNLLTYCLELYTNKLKEKKITELNIENLEIFTRNIIDTIKQSLKDESDEKRNKIIFIGLINFFEKLIITIGKGNIETSEKLNKNLKSMISIFDKIIEKFGLKNMENKINEIRNKIL